MQFFVATRQHRLQPGASPLPLWSVRQDAWMAKCALQFLRESDAPTPAWCITVRGWLQPDVFIKAQWVWEPVASFFQSLHTAVDPFRDIRMAVPWSPVLTTSQRADCLLGGSGEGP